MRPAEEVEAGERQFGYTGLQFSEKSVVIRLVIEEKVPVVRVSWELHNLTPVG